jgi:hypothetical protein
MKRLQRRVKRLEARVGPQGFCVDSGGHRFLYFGGEGVAGGADAVLGGGMGR